MSYANNDHTYDNATTGSTGFDAENQGQGQSGAPLTATPATTDAVPSPPPGQQRRAPGQVQDDLSALNSNTGTGTFARGQGQGRDNTSGMYGTAGEDQFIHANSGSSGGAGPRDRQYDTTAADNGTTTAGDTSGSSGTDAYGAGAGMGGAGTGISAAGAGTGMGAGDSSNGQSGTGAGYGGQTRGAGYGQSGVAGQQQPQKASLGDKMRGGLEKVAGKVTKNPELVERGEERATGQFDTSNGQRL